MNYSLGSGGLDYCTRNYTDKASAVAWTEPSFIGTAVKGTASAFFAADAKVVS